MPAMDKADKPLGFWMCTSLIVGNVIGMGIFLLPAALAPFGWNAFLGWGITLIGCTFIAYAFAQLARTLPQQDGPYGYTRHTFGGGMAFFVMWCYWVSTWITNATIAIGVVGYLEAIFPIMNRQPLLAPAVALGLIWIFVLVNLLGARTSGRVQMVSTVLKLLPLAAVILLGIMVLMTDSQAYARHLPSSPLSLEATAAAATVSLFSMLGVECATIPAGKVDNPETTIPRATIAGTLFAALVYIGVSAIPLLLLPQAGLEKSSAPFADLLNHYWGAGSGRWLAFFVVISGIGALNGWTLVAGELTASFARHGVFPESFMRANRHGAPSVSLILMGVLASAMIVMNYNRSLAEGFTFLSVMVTAANLPLYLVGGMALFILWRRGTVDKKIIRLLFSAAMTCIYSLWIFYGVGKESMLWAIALGAVSLPVYWFMRHRKNARNWQVRANN
jgi:APA family basic amino acid/polyamine antiporter